MDPIGPFRFKRDLRAFCKAVVLLVLLASVFRLSVAYAEVSPQTIYVDVSNLGDPYEDGSHGHPFDKIQEGVDAASPGDTVTVAPGIYYEEVVFSKNKSRISLIGEEGAVIDGEGRGNGIRVGVHLRLAFPPEYLDNVTITGFTVRNCVKGITLMRCRHTRLRNNTIVGNLYNFADYSYQVNNADTSNTVNGKPIYYWVNEHEKQVPLDAGYVGLVGCRNIIVKDLKLSNNGQGVLLKNTTFSRIENVSVFNNQDGIYLELESTNNTVVGNTVSNNTLIGIYLSTSSDNIVSGNMITNNSYGVYLTTSYGTYATLRDTLNNVVVDNNIEGHWKGLVLYGHGHNIITDNIVKGNEILNNTIGISTYLSAFNLIYHNNLVNNTNQVEYYESENTWDYMEEGNYWSDYDGADLDGDGFGDTSYVIDQENRDNFPLMGLFKSFKIVWDETTYILDTISSSVVSSFGFSQPEKSVAFDASTEGDEMSFCRVTLPEVVLGGPYHVLVGGSQAAYLIENSNGTHAFLHFMYFGSDVRVEIFGETVIPEFSLVFLLPFLMIATLFVVFLQRKHLLKGKVDL